MQTIGHATYLRERTARIVAANPHLREKILGRGSKPVAPRPNAVAPGAPRKRVRKPARFQPEPFVEEAITILEPVGRNVIAAVARVFNIRVSRLMLPGQTWAPAHARAAAYRILRARGWSTTKIGKLFGRDHTTVMSGLRRAAKLYATDPRWRHRLETTRRFLRRRNTPSKAST